jgi:para-nitrobenzyl esterase
MADHDSYAPVSRPRPPAVVAIFLLLLAVTGCSSSNGGESTHDAGNDLIVTLPDGVVQGDLVGGSDGGASARRFLKIPFAKPPVAALRWKAPVRNDPWTTPRHETSFADPCPQSPNQQNAGSTNEDCLYLNVWAPEPAPSNAAVMVWFYGGANIMGATSDDVPTAKQLWYDGQFFAARHNVVLVTVNYRVGVMGFFAHPALAAEQSPLGNQGLLDQRAALQWVQRDISAFGGDPNNVTIFGESAGSIDVCYHLASPGDKGLFGKAISESTGCTSTTVGGVKVPTATDVAADLGAFAKALGCDTAADPLACLRSQSVSSLLAASPQLSEGSSSLAPSFTFGVVVDGPGGFLPDQPRTLYDNGQIAHVPYLLGSNNDEGMLFILTANIPTSDSSYATEVQNRFGSFAPQVLAEYPVSKFNGDYRLALGRIVGDSALVCGTLDTARRAANAGLPVFMYNFNMPWQIDPTLLLASHASEISHVFGDPVHPTSGDTTVSDAMIAFWAHFAQTGDPNFSGAPATWPSFGPDPNGNDQRLQLDTGFEDLTDFRKEECAVWGQYYDQGFAGQ